VDHIFLNFRKKSDILRQFFSVANGNCNEIYVSTVNKQFASLKLNNLEKWQNIEIQKIQKIQSKNIMFLTGDIVVDGGGQKRFWRSTLSQSNAKLTRFTE